MTGGQYHTVPEKNNFHFMLEINSCQSIKYGYVVTNGETNITHFIHEFNTEITFTRNQSHATIWTPDICHGQVAVRRKGSNLEHKDIEFGY